MTSLRNEGMREWQCWWRRYCACLVRRVVVEVSDFAVWYLWMLELKKREVEEAWMSFGV